MFDTDSPGSNHHNRHEIPLPRREARTVPDVLLPVVDVPVSLSVEVGRRTMTIRETLTIAPGTVISVERMAGETFDLLMNGRPVARGELVAVDENFGLRVTEVLPAGERPAAAGQSSLPATQTTSSGTAM